MEIAKEAQAKKIQIFNLNVNKFLKECEREEKIKKKQEAKPEDKKEEKKHEENKTENKHGENKNEFN